MIFSPTLCARVLTGEKTVTRRRLVHRGGRPIQYVAGKTYAVQPGRGKKHVGHIMVRCVETEPLFWLNSEAEAQREGFKDAEAFRRYWAVLHGEYDPDEVVARIGFELTEQCAECAK